MLVRFLFFLLLLLALLGDARIFLFILNRLVLGSHRHEKSPWTFLIWTVPPILLGLTALFWPLHRWLDWLIAREAFERITPQRVETLLGSINYARVGLVWMIIAASVGIYWLVDRFRMTFHPPPQPHGVRTFAGEVVRLRRAHVPFAWLRRLGAHNDVYDIEVTRHEVFIDDLPMQFDGYRVAFLTDTHVAAFVRKTFYEEVVNRVNLFDPDLVLLGGDFVTWNRHIKLMVHSLLTNLRARDGILAVLGNHDYWADGPEVRAAMEAKGAKFIINASHVIQRDGAELQVVGIDEVYRGEPDLNAAFAGVSGPRLGLSHHPDIIDILDGRRIDLLVCGHTHGGQIRLPFFGPIVVPSQHEGRYASGFARVGQVLMYVSRGVGAIPPLRILCKPEVATFVLRQGRR